MSTLADSGVGAQHDPALLTLVLHDVPRGELRLVSREDDRVGGKTREPALWKLILKYRLLIDKCLLKQ